MQEWTKLGFRVGDTSDNGPFKEMGLPLQVFDVFPRISEIRCGVFLGWEEDISWWQSASPSISPKTIAEKRVCAVTHQTSGHSCAEFTGQLRQVRVAESMQVPIVELCRHYYDSQLHAFGYARSSAKDEYRSRVAELGLSADFEFKGVREGTYPLDATTNNLGKLLDPNNPWVAEAKELSSHYAPARDQLRLFVLAENSD